MIYKKIEIKEMEHFWSLLNALDAETNFMMYELGEGIITDIDGEEIFSKVTIQFANCKKVIYRDWIDKGDYHKEIRNIKENLASDTYSNVIIKSVYNRLVVE